MKEKRLNQEKMINTHVLGKATGQAQLLWRKCSLRAWSWAADPISWLIYECMQVRALLEWIALGLENSDEPLKFSGHYPRINLSESHCTMKVWLFHPLTEGREFLPLFSFPIVNGLPPWGKSSSMTIYYLGSAQHLPREMSKCRLTQERELLF